MELVPPYTTNDHLIESSSKMAVVDKLLLVPRLAILLDWRKFSSWVQRQADPDEHFLQEHQRPFGPPVLCEYSVQQGVDGVGEFVFMNKSKQRGLLPETCLNNLERKACWTPPGSLSWRGRGKTISKLNLQILNKILQNLSLSFMKSEPYIWFSHVLI